MTEEVPSPAEEKAGNSLKAKWSDEVLNKITAICFKIKNFDKFPTPHQSALPTASPQGEAYTLHPTP